MRAAWAEIDLAAIRHNVRTLAAIAAPAQVCAVVKAWGYGHGPVRVAEAALAGGATSLGVALVAEGVALRRAEITEPVLLLSEPPPVDMADAVRHDLTTTLYTHAGVEALAKAVSDLGRGRHPVHLKVDTGMHRVGAAPATAVDLALDIAGRKELDLQGVFTHFAVADEPDNDYTARQLGAFRQVLDDLAARGIEPPLVHAANSAGAIAVPEARMDLVRCGIAVYGLAPSPALAAAADLRPALSLKAEVSLVKEVEAGERISYGLRYRFDRRAVVATVPIGYADGVPRRLGATGGEVLIGGRRRPIAGTVTMDQLCVDCGDASVEAGDEVVLIGRQGNEEITADEWAARLDTINYEIVCGIGPRVPRRYA